MGAQWDRLRAARDRTTHGLDGDFVRPGGAVGLLLLVCAVVGLPGGVVGDPVVRVVGATVGELGATVGVAVGVFGVLVGVLLGVLVDSPLLGAGDGRTDRPASGAGVTTGLGAGLAASGNGTNGVSRLGPPSRLLTISTR